MDQRALVLVCVRKGAVACHVNARGVGGGVLQRAWRQCTFLEAGALLHVVAPRGEASEHRTAAGAGEDSRLRLGISITLALEQATIAAISETAAVGRGTAATSASGDGGCPLFFRNATAGHALLGGCQLRFLHSVVGHIAVGRSVRGRLLRTRSFVLGGKAWFSGSACRPRGAVGHFAGLVLICCSAPGGM